MAPKKNHLPKPLPEGFILTDTEKNKWRLGKIIGQGGFGLIYLASRNVDQPVPWDTKFVIKVEHHDNGPLFSELKFYQRAAKEESILRWMRNNKVDFLGIPAYWGSGLAEHAGHRYRFMAMNRLGSDLQRVCDQNGGRLKKSTVLLLGQRLVDVLQYIHENEYVHADIKAGNLMLSYIDPDQVYLADYGLSYRYNPDGVHKEYKENPKRAHNGTIEYTSLDAHKGVAPSRRSDLQNLGFCLLHWLCGSLPWDSILKNPTEVQEQKTRLLTNLPGSVQQLSVKGATTDELADFFLYVRALDYTAKPNYQHLKQLLGRGVGDELDLSKPEEPSGANTGEPHGKSKKLRRSSTSGSEPPEKVKQGKSSPIAACYLRSPPIFRSQTHQREDIAPIARSRPRFNARSNSDDDGRSRPISPSCLRGPPLSPSAQHKQV